MNNTNGVLLRSDVLLLLLLLSLSPLYRVFTRMSPQTNHVPMGYTVAATLLFYCQYAVWCVSPSFLRWF